MDVMIRRLLPGILLTWVCGMSFAQQMHWLRLAEDTAYYGRDYLPEGINVTATGPAQSWNFRSLKAPYSLARRIAVSSEREGLTYANLIHGNATEAILKVKGKQSEVIQIMDDNPVCPDSKLTFTLTPALRPFFNGVLGEQFLYRGRMSAVFPWPRHLTCAWSPSPLPDSCRVTYVYTEEAIVDGEGIIYLPTESNQAFRQRVEIRKAIQVEVRYGNVWKDVTQSVPGIRLLTTHSLLRYVSSTTGMMLAEIELSDGMIPHSVLFKTHPMLTRVFAEEPVKSDVFAYPNPSYDIVRFQLHDLPHGSYTLKIFNIVGVPLREMTFNVDHPRKTVAMDLSDLQRGTYLYRLQDRHGRTIKTKRILLIQP